MIKNVANILTSFRILGSVLLLFFPAFSKAFYCTYLFCGFSDMIDGTVSYANVYEILRKEMQQPSNLLEHVCNRISKRLYEEFKQITAIGITLSKDTPPM